MVLNNSLLFSILIPAYKREFLSEAIESCLSQTYKQFEIIIVDDNSPEDLLSIVRPYLNDERIHYYRNTKNCGAINVVDNWNICLNYSKGDFVICMGDDDRLLPCCLNEYAHLINDYPDINVLHGWTEIIDEKGDFLRITVPRPEWEDVYSVIWNRWLWRADQFIGDWCFRRELLFKSGGFVKFPLAWGSDDVTAVMCANNGGVVNTNKICFQYRVNNSTITNSSNAIHKMEAIVEQRQWFDEFLSIVPQNELSQKYYKDIKSKVHTHWDKMFGYVIEKEIQQSPFNILKWIRNRQKYKYSMKSVFYAIERSIVSYRRNR